MHQLYVEPTRQYADLVVNGAGPLEEAVRAVAKADALLLGAKPVD
jgi:uridine kinase